MGSLFVKYSAPRINIQEVPYGAKLYEQKSARTQADYFPLNSGFIHCVSELKSSFIADNFITVF
jgi:hypothetical protein